MFFFCPQIVYSQNSTFYYRTEPTTTFCVVETTPLRPNSVEPDTIEVNQLQLVEQNLSISLSWDFPEVTNGLISGFDIRITTVPLLASEEQAPIDVRVLQRTLQVSGRFMADHEGFLLKPPLGT